MIDRSWGKENGGKENESTNQPIHIPFPNLPFLFFFSFFCQSIGFRG
jgi:hypothetical protein